MDRVPLSDLELFTGILYLIGLIFTIIWGYIALKKALETRHRLIFEYFIVIITMGMAYHVVAIGFILWLTTGKTMIFELHVIIGTTGIPITLLAWLDIYLTIVHPTREKLKKITLIAFAIISIIIYSIIVLILLTAPKDIVEKNVGYMINHFDAVYTGIWFIYGLFAIGLGLLAMLHFALFSAFKTETRETQLKGRLILFALIFYIIGTVGIAVKELITNPLLLTFRTFLVLSQFFFFLGFTMPKFMKKILKLE